MIQSPTMLEEALLRKDPQEAIIFVEPSASSPLRTPIPRCPCQRMSTPDYRSGHIDQAKKAQYKLLVVQRERGMAVEVPHFCLPAKASSGRAHFPIADCSSDGSRHHAFE